MTNAHVIALLACLVLTSGCQREESTGKRASAGDGTSQDASPDAAQSTIGRVVAKAMDRAREEMATRNLKISDDNGGSRAEITPQGDLLVAGE